MAYFCAGDANTDPHHGRKRNSIRVRATWTIRDRVHPKWIEQLSNQFAHQAQ